VAQLSTLGVCMNSRCVADVEGPWVEPDWDSGLIARCREYWNVQVSELPNGILATYLRQSIGLSLLIPEARKRIAAGIDDGSEMFDGELREALQRAVNVQPGTAPNGGPATPAGNWGVREGPPSVS
jgi:hypothetical protein